MGKDVLVNLSFQNVCVWLFQSAVTDSLVSDQCVLGLLTQFSQQTSLCLWLVGWSERGSEVVSEGTDWCECKTCHCVWKLWLEASENGLSVRHMTQTGLSAIQLVTHLKTRLLFYRCVVQLSSSVLSVLTFLDPLHSTCHFLYLTQVRLPFLVV